ncbi:hypothetical protein Poly51_43900 [Rubripirellula tenax]|uniref:Uncharacterized protein n=1 Tax=Rubripirellula tenax TaxID=2528015 RepID=A0A5C6EHJ9_9BACT|nr:hypothetical protein [Rubripirellula tenax]TWU48492.1 hypothetical protein Poly51_43900 [Rubripirellula tenax]
MATRLSVVMVHATPPTATAQKISETLVGELIGRPGFDLVLVDALECLSDQSTDHLTLESLSGDVVVLAWRSVETTIADLARLGFSGQRVRHSGDPHGGVHRPGERSIFGFHLGEFAEAGTVLGSLQGLLASRGIKTFTIAGLPPVDKKGKVPQHPIPARSPIDTASQAFTPTDSSAEGLDLDALLDQLDQSDR